MFRLHWSLILLLATLVLTTCVSDDDRNTNNECTDDRATCNNSLKKGDPYCFDDHVKCHAWASRGECESNPSYMKVSCRLSCGVCIPTSSFPWCQDLNSACGYWASQGFCETNRPFMLGNCARSCGQCPVDPLQNKLVLVKEYKLLEKIYHNTDAFTQGLTYGHGTIYESTGNYAKSEVRKVDPQTGKFLKSLLSLASNFKCSCNPFFPLVNSNTNIEVPIFILGRVVLSRQLPDQYFGEGVTLFDKSTKLMQLTYKEKIGFIYDSTTLELLHSFEFVTHTREGWGVTHDEKSNTFFVSDGSEWIFVWDASSLKELRRMRVTMPDGEPLKFINELEFIKVNNRMMLLANVWTTDVLVSINPENGVVESLYDLTNLWPYYERPSNVDVFNGISKSEVDNEVYVTGKWWPHIYKISLLE